MANAVWPGGLPQLVAVDGYRESPPDNLIRTPMDEGPDHIRRARTSNSRAIQVQLDLTMAQIEILDDFYVSTLSDGSLPFDWVRPRQQTAATLRFVIQPTYTPQGGSDQWWRAAMVLEIMP